MLDDAEAAGVWVNSADDPARCTFTLPARVRRGDLLVTVSTGGRSPALAAVAPRAASRTSSAPSTRRCSTCWPTSGTRMRAEGRSTEGLGWRAALDSGMLELVREGDVAGAKERSAACLSSSSA